MSREFLQKRSVTHALTRLLVGHGSRGEKLHDSVGPLAQKDESDEASLSDLIGHLYLK